MAKTRSKSKPKAAKASASKTASKDKLITRVIAKPAFLALVKSLKVYASDMDDARSDIASAISAAVKTKYLHKRAFAIFRTLDKMPQQKRDETLRQLMMMGAHAGWKNQKDLFDGIQLVDPKKKDDQQPDLNFRTPADQKGNGKERDVTKPDPAAARKALDLQEPGAEAPPPKADDLSDQKPAGSA